MRLFDQIAAVLTAPVADEPAPAPSSALNRHSLVVYLPTPATSAQPAQDASQPRRAPAASTSASGFKTLLEKLARAVTLQHAGRYEGYEPAEGGVNLLFTGPNADRLATVTMPHLRAAKLPPGATITRTYGLPGAKARTARSKI